MPQQFIGQSSSSLNNSINSAVILAAIPSPRPAAIVNAFQTQQYYS